MAMSTTSELRLWDPQITIPHTLCNISKVYLNRNGLDFIFKRDGNDLVVNQKISLLDALTGKTVDLTTLDGRYLAIPATDIIKPGHEMVILNEGMPISKEPHKKGNLRIKFDVTFPSRLSAEQKSDLKRVLGGADSLGY